MSCPAWAWFVTVWLTSLATVRMSLLVSTQLINGAEIILAAARRRSEQRALPNQWGCERSLPVMGFVTGQDGYLR